MRSRYDVEGSMKNFQNADGDCNAASSASDLRLLVRARSAWSASCAAGQLLPGSSTKAVGLRADCAEAEGTIVASPTISTPDKATASRPVAGFNGRTNGFVMADKSMHERNLWFKPGLVSVRGLSGECPRAAI